MKKILINALLTIIFINSLSQTINAQVIVDINDTFVLPDQVPYPYEPDLKPGDNAYLKEQKKKGTLIDRQNRVVEDMLNENFSTFYNVTEPYDY